MGNISNVNFRVCVVYILFSQGLVQFIDVFFGGTNVEFCDDKRRDNLRNVNK